MHVVFACRRRLFPVLTSSTPTRPVSSEGAKSSAEAPAVVMHLHSCRGASEREGSHETSSSFMEG